MQIAQKNFYKKFLGRKGEIEAGKFLVQKGYKILERNFKTHIGEVDIIALDEDTICFVEVKTRTSSDFGAPSEAVNEKKQQKYYLVAEQYLLKNKKTECPCRFDVVEIENGKINLIKDAFSR